MREPPGFRDLVGDDLPPEERERLARVDALLRSVPAPPAEVPHKLTQSVAQLPLERHVRTRPRVAAALALAAAVAALFFGVGRWTADGGVETRFTVAMEPTESASGASGLIKVGERDEKTGNWQLELEVSGLRKLPPGGYYILWLAKDGEYAGTCGTFAVGEGETTVTMTVSYRLRDFDAWVITERSGAENPPWLLTAKI